MNESILNSIKQGLGLNSAYEAYNNDLIIHINSVFMLLSQLGVGPAIPSYTITGEEETWEDFFSEWGKTSIKKFPMIKSYMIMRVKLIFDAPTNGTHMQALKDNIAEFEWRMNVQVDPDDTFSEDNQNE